MESFACTSWVIVVIGTSLPIVLGLQVCFVWWVFALLAVPGAVLYVGFGLMVFFALLDLLCWLIGCFVTEIPL